jgi:hypothetical protein
MRTTLLIWAALFIYGMVITLILTHLPPLPERVFTCPPGYIMRVYYSKGTYYDCLPAATP